MAMSEESLIWTGAILEPPILRKAFGKFLELWRRQAGLSIIEFANKAGLNVQILQLLELTQEPVPLSEKECDKIAKAIAIQGVNKTTIAKLSGIEEIRNIKLQEAIVRFVCNTCCNDSDVLVPSTENSAYKTLLENI